MIKVISSACLALAVLAGCGTNTATEDHSSLEGYYSSRSVWKKTDIAVCWENIQGFAVEREMVRQRIADTWAKYSQLNFTGWEACQRSGEDIRIRVADSGPRTLGLGTSLDNRRNGMLLNFTFDRWGSTCTRDDETRTLCIESIAIHEFGHALGFSHEHNRRDRDEDCTEAPQGGNGDRVTGEFDRDSIMNYCFNSSYTNQLSPGDQEAIAQVYGQP